MTHTDHHHETHSGDLVTCPVCMMKLDRATVKLTADHEGETIHFCNAACQRAFHNNPAKFAARLTGLPGA